MLCSKKSAVMTTSIVSVDEQSRNTDLHSNETTEMDQLTIFMNRGKGGYGFSVTGAKPTKVGRVEPGSTADQAGIEQWDSIIRINGQNVAHLDMVTVANIVKSCDRHILIDIQRHFDENCITTKCQQGVNAELIKKGELHTATGGTGSTPWHDYSFDSASDVTSYHTSQMPEALAPWKRNPNISPWELYRQLKQQQQAEILEKGDLYDTESEYSYFSDVESNFNFSSSTLSSDKENLPSAKMMRMSTSPTPQENSVTQKAKFSQRKGLLGRDTKGSGDSEVDRCTLSSFRSFSPIDSNLQSGTERNNHSQLSEDSGIEIVSRLPVAYHNLTNNELEKQQLIKKLHDSEVEFRGELRYGMTQYGQPLERGIVSEEQHKTLFQNIEQLLSMSSRLVESIHVNLMSYSDVLHQKHMDNIGSVLAPQIDRLCVEYERYCTGVRESLTLFMELRKIRDFDRYLKRLQQGTTRPKLSAVLQKPVEHIKNMTLCMQKIYKLTDSSHHDYESLQEVVRALRRCSGNISQEYIRQSQSNLTTITTSNATLQETSSVASTNSVDSEVHDIQNRLLFGDNVRSFQLANTLRHVIYTGDLEFDVDSRFKKVHVILMNDVLLLTHKGDDNFLTALEKPILLHDIKGCTQSPSNHPSEFQLKVECHHCETLGFEPRFYNFRAKSLELKCVWKNLLHQRIDFIKTQRQFTQNRVSELV